MYDDDAGDSSSINVWPAFADLLAATSLLFLVLFSVVALPQRGGVVSSIAAIKAALDTTIALREDVTVNQVGDYILVQIKDEATFPRNRHELHLLRPAGRRILSSLAQRLITDSLMREIDQIHVVGHASREGPNDLNWFLSSARAATVAMFLIDTAGVPPCKVSALGRSSYYPLDLTRVNLSEDRRIELEIRPIIPSNSSQEERRARCFDGGSGR